MKVLLLRDVFKLGRAGDVKKVADGYGRNYLLPQGLAVLATQGMMKQAERIRDTATKERTRLNQELGSVAEQLEGVELVFPVKAGETGRLYGSVTTSMLADALLDQTGVKIERRQIDSQPLKTLGVHPVSIRLTIDLVPEIKVVVHHEDEPPESAYELEEDIILAEASEDFAELRAELEAEEAELAAQAEEAELAAQAEEAELAVQAEEAEAQIDDEGQDSGEDVEQA
jgi:large subunit ribosomal protein L9